jgi:hypothetical protein
MDNRYWSNSCPALMSDGRFITNYIRFNVFDQFIRNINDIGDNHDYRAFLQNNAGEIIRLERDVNVKQHTCNVNGKCMPLSGKGIKINGKKSLNVLPLSNAAVNVAPSSCKVKK